MLNYIKRRIHLFTTTIIEDVVEKTLSRLIEEDCCDLKRAMQRKAANATAVWIVANVPLHLQFEDRFALLKECTKLSAKNGLFMEFGVYRGDTINFIAKQLPEALIHGFDSFEGLNEPWIFRNTGAFKDVKDFPIVESNVRLIKGWFNETLPLFMKNNNETVSLLHIDSDLYSSAKTILECTYERFIPGTVIIFDEFFNYPGWENGEHKAWMEIARERKINFEYIGYTYQKTVNKKSGNQLAVLIT
jgi:hypothetical protein